MPITGPGLYSKTRHWLSSNQLITEARGGKVLARTRAKVLFAPEEGLSLLPSPLSARKLSKFQSCNRQIGDSLNGSLSAILNNDELFAGAEHLRLKILHQCMQLPPVEADKRVWQSLLEGEEHDHQTEGLLPPEVQDDLAVCGIEYLQKPVSVPLDQGNPHHRALLALDRSMRILRVLQSQRPADYRLYNKALQSLEYLQFQVLMEKWPQHFNEYQITNLQLTSGKKVLWRADHALYPQQAEILPGSKNMASKLFRLVERPVTAGAAMKNNWQSLSEALLPEELYSQRPDIPDVLFTSDSSMAALENHNIFSAPDFDDTSTISRCLSAIKADSTAEGVHYDSAKRTESYNPDNEAHVLLARIMNLRALNAGIRETAGELERQGKISSEAVEKLLNHFSHCDSYLNSLSHKIAAICWPENFSRETYGNLALSFKDRVLWSSLYCYPRSKTYLQDVG